MSAKKIIPITAIVAVAVLGLAGCVTTDTTTDKTIPLTVTPKIDTVSLVLDEAKFPEGFIKADTNAPEGNEGVTSENPETTTGAILYLEDNSCLIQYQVIFEADYYSGWGDEYISRNYGWTYLNTPETQNVEIGKKYLPTTSGYQLEAFTVNWEINGYDLVPDTSAMALYRGIDVSVETGYDPVKMRELAEADGQDVPDDFYPTVGPQGSDPKLGEPLISVNYSCFDGVKTDPKVFEQALSALTIDGVKSR